MVVRNSDIAPTIYVVTHEATHYYQMMPPKQPGAQLHRGNDLNVRPILAVDLASTHARSL